MTPISSFLFVFLICFKERSTLNVRLSSLYYFCLFTHFIVRIHEVIDHYSYPSFFISSVPHELYPCRVPPVLFKGILPLKLSAGFRYTCGPRSRKGVSFLGHVSKSLSFLTLVVTPLLVVWSRRPHVSFSP